MEQLAFGLGLDPLAAGPTAQIGRVSVLKVENKGKGFRRIRIALEG